VAYHAVKIEQATVEAPAGRAARQQALIQEVQQLRKALQKYYALQRRLETYVQGRGACRALKRQRRKLACEVSKLQDLLAEREENMREQERQLRGLPETPSSGGACSPVAGRKLIRCSRDGKGELHDSDVDLPLDPLPRT
jgi:hypothetical protein